jgi:hypothetical protein
VADGMEEGTALVFLRENGAYNDEIYVTHFDYKTLHQNIHAKSGQLVGTVILEIKFY